MPRIRVLQSVAGDAFAWRPGEIVDVSADEAAKWADGERAELVRDAPAPRTPKASEKATRRPDETR